MAYRMEVFINADDGSIINKTEGTVSYVTMINRKTGANVDADVLCATIRQLFNNMTTHEMNEGSALAITILCENKDKPGYIGEVEHYGSFLTGFMCGRMLGTFEHKANVDISVRTRRLEPTDEESLQIDNLLNLSGEDDEGPTEHGLGGSNPEDPSGGYDSF